MEQFSKTILLLINHSCNLNCKYCYEKFKNSKKMTWEQANRILEKELSDDSEDVMSVDLLGGEPLINFSLIPRICDWIWGKRPDLKIYARTNGTLLNAEMKNWLVFNKERFTLGLSIDGIPEVNYINRGINTLDLDFFKKNWPDNPVKMTIYPESVKFLSSSLEYLYDKGFKVIGDLAQGVFWDERSCSILKEQLDILCEYYLSKPHIEPLDSLFDFNFHKAFWIPNSELELDPPCWSQANIHTYDCDGDFLPCHMFSSIVQGEQKRKKILLEAANIVHELLPKSCMECSIRWRCKNCMAMNYQHTGDFGHNINLEYMCEAQRNAACASAKLLVYRAVQNALPIDSDVLCESITNAIKYLKLSNEIINE